MWKGFRYVFMDEETGGEGSAGGAGAGESNSDGSTGAAAVCQAEATGAGDVGETAGSAAAAIADGSGTALQSGAATTTKIPEKYQVKKEDGTLDVEASSLKLAEAYGNLEKRIGTGDIPPKAAGDYEIAVPDMFKDAIDPKTDPIMQDFITKAHAAGFTQKQMDLAMGEYFAIAPQLVASSVQLSAEDCTAQLRTEWKTDDQYKSEVGKAYKAAVGYAGDDADYIIKTYGNDPKVIRMLNRVGAEMGEDKSLAPAGSSSGGQSVDALMSSPAYNDPKDPNHARVSEQVRKHFEAQANAAAKAGNAPLM